MGLEPQFTDAEIDGVFDNFKGRVESHALEILKYVGEQFVNAARMGGSYTDRTGNLRGSIGYVIGYNGQIKERNLTGTAEGVRKGLTTANEVLSENSTGFVLIGFAGMEYAASVESKGYEVITGSSIQAKRNLGQIIKSL